MKLILQQIEKEQGVTLSNRWYLEEAQNKKHLEHGGTFRNTLTLKMEEILTPLLADCIKEVDVNCNLDLISVNCTTDAYITKVWMKMFNYFFTSHSLEVDAILGSTLTVSTFKCRMPFHWVLQSIVNSELEIHFKISSSGKSRISYNY